MTELAVVKQADLSEMTLDELAAAANEHHAKALNAASEALKHAIAVGGLLEQIRENTLQGGWGKWIEDNLDFSRVTANVYRRIFYYRHELDQAPNASIAGAVRQLRGQPRIDSGPVYRGLPTDQATRQEIVALHEEGMAVRELADLFGKDKNTIRRWVDPEYRKRSNELVQRRRAKIRKERQDKKRADQHRFIRKRGGNTGHTYGLIRQATQAIDRALEEEKDREIREALRRAESLLHQADAAIVKALGLK